MNMVTPDLQSITPVRGIAGQMDALDWMRISNNFDTQGSAVIEKLVSPEECIALVRLYARDDIFRSQVVMSRHGFGRGEYKYFSYPLPGIITELRTSLLSKVGGDR